MDQEELQRKLGRTIAARRRARGVTQEVLAELVGSSPEWCSQLERGVGAPSLGFLAKVAEVLGTTPADLLEAAMGRRAGRRDLERLMARAERLPDGAVRVLVAAADALERELGVADVAEVRRSLAAEAPEGE